MAAEFALILGAFALGTSEFASMGLLPEMARQTHASIPEAGEFVSAYAIGVVVGVPSIAAIAAKASRRTLLVSLLGFFILGNLATALAGHYGSLVAARFVSGLPHGAYFGVAVLVAAHMAHPGKRAQAMARVMMGISLANLIGAPLGSWIGEKLGWQATYIGLAMLGLIAGGLCRATLPELPAARDASARRELGALTRLQVWLTLGMGAVGLGGLFSAYTYLAPALAEVTHAQPSTLPLALCVIGVGMFFGNFVGAWMADRGVMQALGGLLLLNVATYALVYFSLHNLLALLANIFVAGLVSIALVPALQIRLIDVAGQAQSLGAMLNGCAINLANAIGAALGGAAIAAGFGVASTGLAGAVLALGGLIIFGVAVAMDKPGLPSGSS
ncbi:MFS transporter [Bradyrhizobium jicamae]|uniref:MFS transporter n=1 Tax=Bradyrhizobium jicamae TaxID=280332 RepID=UPI0032DFCA1B